MKFHKIAQQRSANTLEPDRLQQLLSAVKTSDHARIVSEAMREMESTTAHSVLEARLDKDE